jgi:site-specific DNA recombinase
MAIERKILRCAVYTRKSSEEGLEQDFNSLQAQREACEAFIASQRGEGWKLVPTAYDDGGLSGGNMERPALRRLLADVTSGSIDVIVVYKVDRLTRSLADFAKMVEVFDARGVSFVAVTQQFNTTTSMGRLTLNVLLSFAQFEREVTGERIRDKIAASKKKGMWMGGPVPLGYRAENRKLIVIPKEADTVRLIFQRYLQCSGVRELNAVLKTAGVRSKNRADKPPTDFSRGALYAVLSNPIYIGQVAHKDQRYPGLHEPIVDNTLWDACQAKLEAHTVRSGSERQTAVSVLIGKIFDTSAQTLTPSHTIKKNGQRYRYYVSKCKGQDGKPEWRLPAAEIEKKIEHIASEMLKDRPQVAGAAIKAGLDESELPGFLALLDKPAPWLEWVKEVQIRPRAIKVSLVIPGQKPVPLEQTIEIQMRRRGVEQRLVIPSISQSQAPADRTMMRTLVRAIRWWDMLKSRQAQSMREIAKIEGVTDRYVARLLPLAMLAPSILEAVTKGQQPPELTTEDLLYKIALPGSWHAQRQLLNFG